MTSFRKIIDYALSQSDDRALSIIESTIKNIQTKTKERISLTLYGYDFVRIFDEATKLAENWEIDTALMSMYNLLKTLRKYYEEIYPFQIHGFSYEDSEHMVSIKKEINNLLIIKTKELFDAGNRTGANKIKNDQLDNIQKSRYTTYEEDRDKWLFLEQKWSKVLDDEDKKNKGISQENSGMMNRIYTKEALIPERKHFVNGKIGSSEELQRQDQWREENEILLQECSNLVIVWELEEALNLCLDRLWFFLGKNPEICTILTITNAPFLPAWQKEMCTIINLMIKDGDVCNRYVLDRLERMVDNQHLSQTTKVTLSKALFKWWT